MTLLSIVITLILEQLHALPVQRAVRGPVKRMAAFLEDKFNDGGHSHGAIAWGLGVALPAALASLVYALLLHFQPLLHHLENDAERSCEILIVGDDLADLEQNRQHVHTAFTGEAMGEIFDEIVDLEDHHFVRAHCDVPEIGWIETLSNLRARADADAPCSYII